MDQLAIDFSFKFTQGSIKAFRDQTKPSEKGAPGTGSGDAWYTAIENFEVWPGLNPRNANSKKFKDAVQRLYQSMLIHGYDKNFPLGCIVVADAESKQHLYVWNGHRRLLAAQMAFDFIRGGGEVPKHVAESFAKGTLPFVQMPEGTTADDILVAMVRSNESEPFPPLELAIQCKRLADNGKSTEWISENLVCSTQYVRNLLKLISAPPEIIEMVQSGAVSESLVVEALRNYGDDALQKLQAGLVTAQKSGKERLTARVFAAGHFKTELRKEAPLVYLTLDDVRNDPGYQSLSDGVRQKLEGVFAKLNPLEGRDAFLAAAAKKAAPKQPKAPKVPKTPAVKKPKQPRTKRCAPETTA